MDALVPAFIVALLAELGDRTQLLATLLGVRFRRPVPVLAGIALATAVNMALAAVIGAEIAGYLNHRAIQLMTGLALLVAASGAVMKVKPAPAVDNWKLGALLSSAGAFFILALGDKTQFVTATIAAGSGHPALAAVGAVAGVVLANAPAVVLGDRWPTLVPLRAIRIGAGVVLALAGIVLVIGALGLS
jgi:putative Ca2+/H+ antiporter (TMEM165/GDT1 family)